MDTKPSRPAQSMKSFKVAFPKEAQNIAEGEQCPNHDEAIYITSLTLYNIFSKLGE